jgi:hypothetical protein
LDRQRKFLNSPQSQKGNYRAPPYQNLPPNQNLPPTSQKGQHLTFQEVMGSAVKDVEVVEGSRKVPVSISAQNGYSFIV